MAKTAFLAANASGGVHREAHRPCPMRSAGADLREQGWQGAKHNISDVSNSAIVEYNCKEFVRSFMRRAEAGGMRPYDLRNLTTGSNPESIEQRETMFASASLYILTQ